MVWVKVSETVRLAESEHASLDVQNGRTGRTETYVSTSSKPSDLTNLNLLVKVSILLLCEVVPQGGSECQGAICRTVRACESENFQQKS